eukprot:1543796-Alexandrium_andersonii.AAC.1
MKVQAHKLLQLQTLHTSSIRSMTLCPARSSARSLRHMVRLRAELRVQFCGSRIPLLCLGALSRRPMCLP